MNRLTRIEDRRNQHKMPRKIRELIRDLENAGFTNRGGKGSHRNFVHDHVSRPVTIAGQPGDDAKPYQEKAVKRAIEESEQWKDSDRYTKVVEWSAADDCYVGSAPGLLFGGCHGDDEQAVFAELCQIVDEVIEILKSAGKPLPPATAGQGILSSQN